MKVLILGAGMMGKAIAYDMARSENVDKIVHADIPADAVKESTKRIGSDKITPIKVDITNTNKIKLLMKEADAAMGVISDKFNFNLAKIAISAGTNFCDLGGNNAIVDQQLSLFEKAEDAGVTIVPDCGLSPGMRSIIPMRRLKKWDMWTI